MNCEECRLRIPELWDGSMDASIDDDARAAVEMHLASCIQCRTENEHLSAIWRGLGHLPSYEPSPALRTRFYEKLEAYQQGYVESALIAPKTNFLRTVWQWWTARPAMQFALSLATLLVGFFAGFSVQHRTDDSQLAQLHNEVTSMRQMVALSLMQQQNASDRLKGVNWAYRVEQPDTQVLAALLYTVNHDSNVNVRLAAVDAFHAFSNSPVAVRGLTQAIAKQDSPMVQIALIDQLTDMRNRDALPALQDLSRNTSVNPEVRQRAQWALGRLQ